MYIPRINSGLKTEVLCLHKLHHTTGANTRQYEALPSLVHMGW